MRIGYAFAIFDPSTRKTKFIRTKENVSRLYPELIAEATNEQTSWIGADSNGYLKTYKLNDPDLGTLNYEFSLIADYNEYGQAQIAIKNELQTDHKVFVRNSDERVQIIQSYQKTEHQTTIRFMLAKEVDALGLHEYSKPKTRRLL